MIDEDILKAPLTLLTENQIWADNCGDGQLQSMKGYHTKTAGMSDLAVLLGGAVCGSNTTNGDGQRHAEAVWSASPSVLGYVNAVDFCGHQKCALPNSRHCGARPALPSSVTSLTGLNQAKPSRTIDGVDVVEYGEYPQTIAEGNIASELEQAFSQNQLQKTGKTYTFDGENCNAFDKPFNAKEHAEYQHQGKKYIRVEAKPYFEGYSTLSNGKEPQAGEVYWVEVQPIEWLRDPSGICVARQALFAGVPFDKKGCYDGDFKKTDMHRYLNTHFYRDSGLEALVQEKAMWAAHEAAPKGKHAQYDGKGVVSTNNRDFAAGLG